MKSMFTTNRISALFLLVCLTLALTACTGKPPTAEISAAKEAIQAARDAGADQYAKAELKSAEDLLALAESNVTSKDYKKAKQYAIQAKDKADEARMLAEREKMRLEQERRDAEARKAANPSSQDSDGGMKEEVTPESANKFMTVYFAYNQYNLDSEAKAALDANLQKIKEAGDMKIRIEGNCDERGSAEYNLALGERRANAVKKYLVSRGLKKSKVSTISFGKERPLDPGHDESAWAKNRRAETTVE
jgi:peptidoglycan-associated lipoprotein